MRSILLTGILVLAVPVHPQSAATTSASTDDAATPALTKTVVVEPNDSPMVRAAKRAVASRVPTAQRRVVSLTTTNTRGRVAFASGPTEGPKALPPAPATSPAPKPQPSQQAEAKRAAEEKLKKLEAEQAMVAAEMDEPYGGDIEEDQVEKRLSEIEAERKKLQQTPPPPPEP
jgi:hypothetical protein